MTVSGDYLRGRFWDGDIPCRIPLSRNGLYKIFRVLALNKGAEIGVSIGLNSKNICLMNGNARLLCIDPWKVQGDDAFYKDNELLELRYHLALDRLALFNCEIMRMTSLEAARLVPLNSLDFVYIDGSHVFDNVMVDIIEWSKRVRVGGIVSGHDYYRSRDWKVIEAVNVYIEAHGIKEWYITSEDGAPSWFWVKEE